MLRAPALVEIKSAHVDSCLHHGTAGLDYARRLADLAAEVRVPTTLNVGSVDPLHPGLVRTTTEQEREHVSNGRLLMEAYQETRLPADLHLRPLPAARPPEPGDHVAWAESNAIVFANSVRMAPGRSRPQRCRESRRSGRFGLRAPERFIGPQNGLILHVDADRDARQIYPHR